MVLATARVDIPACNIPTALFRLAMLSLTILHLPGAMLIGVMLMFPSKNTCQKHNLNGYIVWKILFYKSWVY